jgi:hypothetical protein
MFLETRYFDDGRAEARLNDNYIEPPAGADCEYEYYAGEVTDRDLQEWIEDEFAIDSDDLVPFLLDLFDGGWVDISEYIQGV